jgi:DNA-binding transcriptional MocR family regulator
MISSGAYDASLDRMRSAMRDRMRQLLSQLDRMLDLLDRDLDPRGGPHVWCRLRLGDSQTAAASAAQAGVAILGGMAFYPRATPGAAGRDRIRLSLPTSGWESIPEGTERLHGALRHMPRRAEPRVVGRLNVVV